MAWDSWSSGRPIWTQADPRARDGRTGSRHCGLGGGVLVVDGGGAANHPGFLAASYSAAALAYVGQGSIRVAIARFLLAAIGLAAEAISAAALWPLVIASVVFVLGIATIVPAVIATVGGRGSSRAAALALNGLYVFAGASCGPLVAQLPIGFSGLMLALAALLMIAAGLVAISTPRTADAAV